MIIQLQVLNYILSSGDTSIIIEKGLTREFFPNYKNEFNFIYDHFKKYNKIPDTVTFLATFPNFEIIQVSEPIDYLVSELFKEKSENFLAETFNNVRDLLMKGKTDEAMNLYVSSVNKASDNKHLEAVNILEDTSRYDEYVEKCNDFKKFYVSTGFKELDTTLGGGIDRQNAYFVISARAGVGKTLVMIKFATAAVERGLNVGMYEGEMTVNKIAGRYDTMVSHISNTAITKGGSGVANAYKAYLENLKSSSKGKFYVLTRDMVGSDKVTVDVLRSFIDKYKLDILFIDQLSLLDSTSRSNKSFEQAAELSKELKLLQVQKHIPIILASQQNRSAIEDGKLAGTENVALSDRISQDCTELVFISKEDNIMTLNIAKARDGAKKYKLQYMVDYDKGTFEYLPEENDILLSDGNDYVENNVNPMNFQTYLDEDEMPF